MHSAEYINLFTSVCPAYSSSLIMMVQFVGEILVALTILVLLFSVNFTLTLSCIFSMGIAVIFIHLSQKIAFKCWAGS